MVDVRVGKSTEIVPGEGTAEDSLEAPLLPGIRAIQNSTRQRVEDQFRALEKFEEQNWIDPDQGKSKILRGLYARIQKLSKGRNAPHAKTLGDSAEVPDALKEKRTPDEDILKKARGEKALRAFTEAAARPYNLFHLDRTLSRDELLERILILEQLYRMYKESTQEERYYMEELINRIFGTPRIEPEVQGYLDHLALLESTQRSAGAENENLIFVQHENRSLMFEDHKEEPRVLKISKSRHNVDFTSILKLMKNMHVLMLRCNRDVETPGGQKLGIRLVADDVMIYLDRDSNYKRLVRQPYAKGIPVQEATARYKDDPAYQDAWKTFLREMEVMKKTDGIVLDLTNSDAPFPHNRMRPRGNVANTKNVFVHREPDGSWLFSIIDPDVFDVVPGEHKFDPDEYRGMGQKFKAVLVGLMNKGRDTTTLGWQDHYVKKELED